jgi:hypothetical protein
MGLISQDNALGFGSSFGHPVSDVFSDIGAKAGFGDPYAAQYEQDISASNPELSPPLGVFHDEGGQVVVLTGEFYGDYEVRLGTQEMFDEGAHVVAYSGIAGNGRRCEPYLQQRRLSFVTPMGLPLGQVLVVAVALESMASPRTSVIEIVKHAHYSRLYQLASLFPASYAVNVAQTLRDERLYT